MSVYASDIIDQLRDLLNDPTDAQVPFLTKMLYVNRAVTRLWPKVYQIATDTLSLTTGTYDYLLDSAVMAGFLLSVEINSLAYPTRYTRFDDYDVIPGDEDSAGRLVVGRSVYTGTQLRIKYAAPCLAFGASANYADSQTDAFTGPDRAAQLLVPYAMSMLTIRKLDDRQDTLRYNTTQATNGVTDQDIISASQMWMAQFELELDAMERPLPPARD